VSLLAHNFCFFLPTVIFLSQILSSRFFCPSFKSFRNACKNLRKVKGSYFGSACPQVLHYMIWKQLKKEGIVVSESH
jgi:hypothetical protein